MGFFFFLHIDSSTKEGESAIDLFLTEFILARQSCVAIMITLSAQ